MTEKEVRDKLLRWLADVMGTKVIQSFQGGKPPAEPYGVLNLMLSGPAHPHPTEWEFPSEGEGEDEVIRQAPVFEWFWRFSVNVYGGEGSTVLRRIRTAQHVPTAYAPLHPLVLSEVTDARNVPELVNEEFRPRAVCEVEVRGIVRDGLVIDVVEEARVEPTLV